MRLFAMSAKHPSRSNNRHPATNDLDNLKHFLQSAEATVLDWQTDFIADRSILAQIEEAASRCNAGIFLFTKDDGLIDKGRATR
jgi:hypothetical protein